MSNDNIKLDTVPQLEVILRSINKDNSDLVNPILEANEIDTLEKQDIKKYLKLYDILNGNISLEALQKEIPGRNFEVEPIEEKLLPNYISMYLYNKKNLEASKSLLEISTQVRSTGMTEDILNKLGKLTKSDSVKHKFVDIKDDIIRRYEDEEYSMGIATGVSFVDEMTGGIHKGELSTVLAYTGHCKTTYAVNIAYNSLKAGQNVLYLSLEVNKENIYFDFISRHSNESKFRFRVGHYDLKKRKLKPEQWDYVKNTIIPDFHTFEGHIYVIDETELDNYSLFSLEAKFREVDNLAIEETGHGIDVVVIDHVQLLKFGSGKQSTSTGEVINEYVSWFRQMAMNWLRLDRQVAFVLLSQANRSGYSNAKENSGKYDLTSMAEANELERASTLIVSIFAEPEMKDMGMSKVQILKYRDSRDENEPTEVNIDLPYYLFGDLDSVPTAISSNISDDTIDTLDELSEGNLDILDSFKGIIPDDFTL